MNPQEQAAEPIVQQAQLEAKNKKYIVIIIILTTLAIIGTGIGIYGMIRLNDVGVINNKDDLSFQNGEHSSMDDGNDLIINDGNMLKVTYPYHEFNTLSSTLAFSDERYGRFEQAVDLELDDVLSSATIKLTKTLYGDDWTEITFSVENGKIKITNEEGDEYIVEKFNNIAGIIEANEEYVTVINNQSEVYYSIISRPIVWSTKTINGGLSDGYELCLYEPYINKLEEFEKTFFDYPPIAYGVKKVFSTGVYKNVEYVYKLGPKTDIDDASDYVTFRPACDR